MACVPWVEKYRPSRFQDIVLDKTNKTILSNILETNYFPNLLFYGPPGTGKTTTIINLVECYQQKYGQKRKGLKIHLNASDDRGIDIIRNQINQFVNTKTLFGHGVKFVILDEIDYMTKNAQQALRYLIHQYPKDIGFCLICNYISRIDTALQNEFMRLRFCRLPEKDIYMFLENIKRKEGLQVSKRQLVSIQKWFKSDIRSMINFLQSNYKELQNGNITEMMDPALWQSMVQRFKDQVPADAIREFVDSCCAKYNMEHGSFIKELINFLIKAEPRALGGEWLDVFRFIIHSSVVDEEFVVGYSILRLLDLYRE